jgi:hypothetical protein
MGRKRWLVVGACMSFAMACVQAVISVWPDAAAYFNAPRGLLASPIRLFVAGETAALLVVVLGLYALSGAGRIRRLPLLRPVLLVTGTLYTLRGMFIIMTVLAVAGVGAGAVVPEAVGSHLVFLTAGIAYLGGVILNWSELGRRTRA